METICKSLLKLVYNRLSAVLTKHFIFKGKNFAELPGGLCREPIAIVESFIHDSVAKKKPLWILSQNISKAFDSVNLKMLEFALVCLRFSASFIQFLLSFSGSYKLGYYIS